MNNDRRSPLGNPAALGAFLRGDIDNFLVASTPGGIEAQEKQGQAQLVNSAVLPVMVMYGTREQLKAMGIEFGDIVDELFANASLPAGWTKRATGHDLWSELRDDKGRLRARIFYKAAFYDRRAHIALVKRYVANVEPASGWGADYANSEWVACVKDSDGNRIWEASERLEPEPPYGDAHKESRDKWYRGRDKLSKLANQYIDSHYPDHENPLAYWDV